MDEIEKAAFELHRDNPIALADLVDYHGTALSVIAVIDHDHEWEIEIISENSGEVLGEGSGPDHDATLAAAIVEAAA